MLYDVVTKSEHWHKSVKDVREISIDIQFTQQYFINSLWRLYDCNT